MARPHSFCNIPLKCGYWDKYSIEEMVSKKREWRKMFDKNLDEYNASNAELHNFIKAKELDNKLADKSKNGEMNAIMDHYRSFFDEESGNTREQGIEQLEQYLKDTKAEFLNRGRKIRIDIERLTKATDIKRQLKKEGGEKVGEGSNITGEENKITVGENNKIEENKITIGEAKKPAEENKIIAEDSKKIVEETIKNISTFFPVIPMYSTILFRILLTLFTFFISFNLINFDLIYCIFNISVIIPPMITSLVWLVWIFYRFYRKVIYYSKLCLIIYRFCKKIYMFCKKKFYSFYKKL